MPADHPPYVIDQMISAKSIAARIESIAREIGTEFAGTDKLVVVGLLRGSFVFIADLVRELDLPVEVDFLEDVDGAKLGKIGRLADDLGVAHVLPRHRRLALAPVGEPHAHLRARAGGSARGEAGGGAAKADDKGRGVVDGATRTTRFQGERA